MSHPSENQKKLNNLLKNQENNVLVDIHSCPIDGGMRFANAFTTVPRNTYVILISNLGQNKTGERDAQHLDRKMYANANWPWRADEQVTDIAQIYYPGNQIFNAEMMFGTPGDPDDEFFNIFNITDGTEAQFNKSDKSVIGREQHVSFSRSQIFRNLRDGKSRIIYIATCDPIGNKPNSWTITKWNSVSKKREKLQKTGRKRFREYVEKYGPQTRTSSRQSGQKVSGRNSVGIGSWDERPSNLDTHFRPDVDSKTPLYIAHVSKNDINKRCITPCDYKTICNIHNAPLIGSIAKLCARKYCKTRIDGDDVECIEVEDIERGKIRSNRRTSTAATRKKKNLRRRRSSRLSTGNAKFGGGGKRRTNKKRKRKTRKRRKRRARKRRTRKR